MGKPTIRFKGYTDDWEQRKFGDDNDLITGYPFESEKFSEDGIKLVRGMNVKRGYLDFSNDICMRWNSTDGLENYLLEADDILIQMDGALIGKSYAKIAEEQLPALLVQRVTRARTRSKDACADFMYQTIQRDFLRYIVMNKTETAVPHLSLNDICNFKIMIPCLEEQQQIGAYFTNIDHLITLHQCKYNGDQRIDLFAWEQRKLGELASSFEYGLNAAAKEYDGENKYIRITDIDDNTHEFLTDNLTSPDIELTGADNYKLTEGDILFARTGASVGKSYIYKNSDGLVYYAGFLIRARIKEEYDAEFVFQNTLTDRYNKYIAVTSQRSGQPGVNAQEYAEFEIKVPQKEEQTKIGTYFHNIDHLITLHQHKCEELKNIKKFMLQNMFVQEKQMEFLENRHGLKNNANSEFFKIKSKAYDVDE